MKFLVDKTVDLSYLIENQFPQFVREDSSTFITFLKSYYESQELKNQPLDIAENLIEYYNISHFRKSELVEKTELSSDINDSVTTITVSSTKGFPDKGYIQIENEIIYYGSKTETQFKDCVRGTSALLLTSVPLSEVSLSTSDNQNHFAKDQVINTAFAYTNEFLRRVKSEIAVGIPENLVEELEISSFLSQIRSFYSSKGSLNSHRILFRILFNDKKIKFTIKNRGVNATLKIINFDGGIGNAQVIEGGSGYDNRTNNGVLINTPIIEIFGSGQGISNLQETAVLTVTSIDSLGGIVEGSTIDPNYTGITITDAGRNYVGPITAFVRERDFAEEEIVSTISGNGIGTVESWDFNTGELTLTNIVGFFTNTDELVSSSGELARGFVKSFEFISQDPDIEFPKDYLFRPSSSTYIGKKIARIEVINGFLESVVNDKIIPPDYVTLVQRQDSIFGVKSNSTEASFISKIDNIGKSVYEIDIDINDDFNSIYLPASTQLTHQFDHTDTVITVDDASGFPVIKGIVYIDGFKVEYDERTANQFLGCTTTDTGSKIIGTEVVAFGRYKTRRQYLNSEFVKEGQERYLGDNLYVSKTTGTTDASNSPTHLFGKKRIGRIEWEYIGDSTVDYFCTVFVGTPEIEATGNQGELEIIVDTAKNLSIGQTVVAAGIAPESKIVSINGKKVTLSLPNISKVNSSAVASQATARVIGLVDKVTIDNGGALFSDQIYKLDDKSYEDFSGIEYTSWNVNSNHTLDTDNDYIGITSIYDSVTSGSGHVYASSSAIPPYTAGKNRILENTFDGYTNGFLTGISSLNQESLLVFRNAVLQELNTDYFFVDSVINFKTVPLPSEQLYSRYFSTTNQISKLAVTQGAQSSDIVLTTSDVLTRDEIFVFLNGVLQVGSSFTYNDSSKTVTFTNQIVTVGTDDILVYTIDGSDILDSITTTSSLTYTLQNSGVNYTTATTDSVIVSINGVVQKPTTSYTISGSTITLLQENSGATLTVVDCGSGISTISLQTLSGINLDRNNYKLQKLVKRIPFPSSIINNNVVRNSKALTPVETAAGIGITVDGIQYQSPKGNNIGYGAVNKLTIDNGGDYQVVYTSAGTFDKSGLPTLYIKKNGGESSDITVTSNIIDIAASISKVNFNLFESSILPNFQGFSDKPIIEVINNNPVINNVQQNPVGFRSAILDVGFGDGTIDNIIIVDGGYGYVESPTIRISGGGKFTTYDVPLTNSTNTDSGFVMSGPIISSNGSSNVIDLTTELGSSFVSNPTVVIDDGSDVNIASIVSNGKVVAVQIFNGGQNYFAEPTLTVISNDGGSGAVLTAKISGGKIVDVNIVNGGSGYSVPPAISVGKTSKSGLISSTLKNWTFNIANRFINGVDSYGGYVFDDSDGNNFTIEEILSANSVKLKEVFTSTDIIVGMEFNHAQLSPGTFVSGVDVSNRVVYLSKAEITSTKSVLIKDTKATISQGDDRIRGSLKVSEVLSDNFPESRLKFQYLQLINTDNFETYYSISSSQHSKIVGWSYDGHPIYCKYGYTTALDNTSGISEQKSSYKLIGIRLNGPSIVDYPLGSFIEDYEYKAGHGTLDQFNGRFCVTPEYPNGVYCYFMVDEYPFVIASSYFSDPDFYNLNGVRTNDQIPDRLTRVNDSDNSYFPEEIKNLNTTLLKTNYTSVGSVDSVFIEKKGQNYKTGDYITFDNSDTGGDGVIAYVSSVESPPVTNAQVDNDKKELTFTFSGTHNVVKNDVVLIDLIKESTNTLVNLDLLSNVIQTIGSKQVYSVVLEKHKKYRLQFGSSRQYNLSFDSLNFNPYHQKDITLTSTYFDIDPSNIPSRIFVHTSTSIYQLTVLKSPLVDRYIVKKNTASTFTLPLTKTISSVDISTLDFSIRSKGAIGPIKTINIADGGAGYRSLPAISGVISDSGTGAILSANSNTIGAIKNINYISYGDQFYGSRNVKNYLDLPITVKVKSNFEITDVKVKTRGKNYLLNPYYEVNNLQNNTNIKFSFSVGEVMSATVINGGSGFDDVPTLELFSQNGGTGATFDVSIGRRNLNIGDTIDVSGGATAKILKVDIKSSTIELLVTSGEFKVNDQLRSSDGRDYGIITHVNSARAYTKARSYGDIQDKFIGTVGFISDDYQRLEDNIYYQDWSYTLANQRNTKDWRPEVLENTHPSGFRLFGKSRIHSRKSLLGRSQNIVRSAITFKATISSLLDLNVKSPECKKQIIYIESDPNPYVINDLIFTTQSERYGRVIEVGPNYIVVALLTEQFEINEFQINILRLMPSSSRSTLDKTLLSVNGIMQTPDVSYDVRGINIIPNFAVFPLDEIITYRLQTPYTNVKPSQVNANRQINLSINSTPFTVPDRDKIIVSLNGVIQRNTNFTVINNSTLQFGVDIQDKPSFVLYHPQLVPITFTGSVGTDFDLGFTPSNNCKLLIFFEGVNQSHHITDFTVSGSTITFPTSVNPSEIFGWQIDETVECEQLSVAGVYKNQIKGKNLICNESKNVTLQIMSDAVKKPNGFFELAKETIDGTLYLDGTTAHGFGSRFKYSNPEYSTSHVEVINDITSQFNGSTTTFDLTINATDPYVPVDGENSLMVTVNGIIVPENEYSVSGSQITFSIAPVVGVTCAIRDFVGSYVANDNTKRGAELDQFNVFNGTRTRFNLSDNGIPETVSNGTDLFTVKNNVLLRPDVHLNAVDSRPNVQLQVAAANKVIYTDVPVSSDIVKLMSFNRQLVPNNHRNWVLDRNEYFDSVRTTFTLLHSYDAEYDDLVNEDPRVESLVVVRNGVYQYPTTDYDLITPVDPHNINTGSGSYRIQFVDPPRPTEDVFIMFHVNSANNFDDLTDGLSQTSSTVLSYTGNITNASTKVPFVYVDGVYQDQNSYTWDNAASTLTFTGTNLPTLATDQVEFHAKLGELRPQNVYGDILNANLVVLQRDNHNEVLVPTVNNTFTVTQRSGSTTISGVDVVNIVQRSSTLTIGTNHYRITNLNLNTLVMYDDPSNTFVAFDGVIQEPGVAYDHSGSGTASSTGIGNGEKYSAISIPMGVGYLAAIDIVEFGASTFTGRQRSVDEINQVYDGSRTKFRLLLDGIKYTNYSAFEDIIISKNNVILHPGVDYTLLNQGGISLLGRITFTVAPVSGDDIWMVGMYDNELITLTAVTSQVYNTSRALSAAEQESIIFVQNDHTKYGLARGAEFTSTTQMNFDTTTTTGTPFAILTTTGKVLDYIHTPYNSSRTQFNLFLEEENFIPNGSFDNDAVVDSRNIFVTKNGSVLTPVVDYNVTGTIDSRIIFTSAPAPGDIIFIKTHGLVKQLDTITGSGVTSYNLTDSSTAYYPNALIGRPREFENQIVAVKNGLVLDPLRDYYVHDNVVRFTTAPTASDSIKLYDYMSKASDIAVESYSQQVKVGDSIFIPGESARREVTSIQSPTVMEVNTPTGITSPSGLTSTPTVVAGELTGVTVTNGGIGYPRKMKFRTYGIGNSASANSFIDPIKGGEVKNTVVVDYEGHNLDQTTLVPTYEAYVVRDVVLSSSDVHFGTKLTSNITSNATTIPVAGTGMSPESDITVTVTSSTGNNAVLQPFVLGGEIVSVDIESGGSGYGDTDSVLVTTNGGGQGAVLEVTLSVSGAITAIDVINGGVGYDSYKAFINNEAIEYTNHDSTNLKGVTRGVAGTTAATATTDTKVIFAG